MGGGRHPRVFCSKGRRTARRAGLLLYMLHTVTHKKIMHGPASTERPRMSINTQRSLSMRPCADPCVHMCPQKAQACVHLLCFPHQDQFPCAVCVRVRGRCCTGRVIQAVHYCWQHCGHKHKQPAPLTHHTPAGAGRVDGWMDGWTAVSLNAVLKHSPTALATGKAGLDSATLQCHSPSTFH